jgi:hypothetical protein
MSSPSSIPPSNRRPAGVPDSGNAKYAVVALLMVGGAVGLFAWRSCASHGDAPAPMPSVTATQTATASTDSKLDDIPLPPPVEEKPEAGPPPRIVSAPVNQGCEGKCSGSITPELEQALQIRGAQTRRCYNQALAVDSQLKGHVTITVRVGPGGNLCSANVTANDMGSPGVANCATNVFRATQSYPQPHGGCVELGVPLSFVPQGQ